MLLRTFTKTKKTSEVIELVTDTERDITSIFRDSMCVASYKGAYSETAENVYYQMLKDASKDGCKIS